MNSTGHGATANKPRKNHEGMAAMGHRRSGGMAGMGKKDHAKKAAAPETKEHGGIAAGAARPPGWLGVVLRWGPEILVASVLLTVVSVAQRRQRCRRSSGDCSFPSGCTHNPTWPSCTQRSP